jgi:dynein heavy chain
MLIMFYSKVYYIALEELQCPLTQNDFSQKYSLMMWPGRIEKQMEKTKKILKGDNERYQKEMEGEQAMFGSTMDSLESAVNNFINFTELSQVDYHLKSIMLISKF